MIWTARRVVTGHTAEGKSTFLMDSPARNVMEMKSMPGLALTDLWETTRKEECSQGNEVAHANRAAALVAPNF